MDVNAIIVLLIVGILAGWIAGLITAGRGFGMLGDMLIGVVGAFLGIWLLSKFGVVLAGILGLLIYAVIGAVVLLIIIRVIRSIISK